MTTFANDEHDDEMMSEINMIPFIDVMLVLLIVFIITVPVMKHAVNIELPQASSEKEETEPLVVNLAVQADGTYWIDNEPVSDEQLPVLLHEASLKTPEPVLQIRGDRNVRYERVAQAMALAHQSGLNKIGFITEPVRNSEP